MEPARDSRFDPNRAVQLLLEIAHEHSVEQLLQKLISRAVSDHPNLACVQVWLIEKGDRCAVCPRRVDCADQVRCLHLAASGGQPRPVPGPGSCGAQELRDPAVRAPLGVGALGQVVSTGKQVILRGRELDGVPELGWLKGEAICGFTGSPITFKGEVLGVTAAYVQERMAEEALPWGLIFANHIGAAIANARAFEEIQRLKTQLEQQNAYLQEEVVEARAFGDLVGESAALRQVISQIDLVAPTEASVLILGQTGTGKELVAREIHRRSPRKDGPLVRVNCASLSKGLFESEFFGHVKGAFTGAVRDRAGRFETAEGGTLFLDEIGEVPLDMQVKLLRVLQEKRYEPVGDDRTREANVRIIAATNRDLKQAVAEGRFREDLYYRLHVFPIHVTTLKERNDDIPLLARHFVERSAKELRCAKPKLTRAAIAQLQNYDWPGNIRELRNVIERAVILARGGLLRFDLPAADAAMPPPEPADAPSSRPDLESGREYCTEAEMVRRERENLLAVLRVAGWKIKGPGGAAQLLGVKPTTLISRMERMELRKPDRPSEPRVAWRTGVE